MTEVGAGAPPLRGSNPLAPTSLLVPTLLDFLCRNDGGGQQSCLPYGIEPFCSDLFSDGASLGDMFDKTVFWGLQLIL